jgi:hypothetical protein
MWRIGPYKNIKIILFAAAPLPRQRSIKKKCGRKCHRLLNRRLSKIVSYVLLSASSWIFAFQLYPRIPRSVCHGRLRLRRWKAGERRRWWARGRIAVRSDAVPSLLVRVQRRRVRVSTDTLGHQLVSGLQREGAHAGWAALRLRRGESEFDSIQHEGSPACASFDRGRVVSSRLARGTCSLVRRDRP